MDNDFNNFLLSEIKAIQESTCSCQNSELNDAVLCWVKANAARFRNTWNEKHKDELHSSTISETDRNEGF